jgi:protein-disulfide isomerase
MVMTISFPRILVASAFALCAALPVGISPASAFDKDERAEIEKIIKEYLLANPELMLEVQSALEEKQMAEQRSEQRSAIETASAAIFENGSDPVMGNPDGKETVVEFFDYNCGFCKRAMNDMLTMMENDGELRFVLKEFPILGPDSEAAHRVAFAFNDMHPEKYGEFHIRLLGYEGRATEDSALKIAKDLGADEAALRAQMGDSGISARIRETYELANTLGITGTPAYVIGDEVVSGALGDKVLAEKVANVRQCGSTFC